MTYRHYSHKPISKVYGQYQLPDWQQEIYSKPWGLWFSVDGNGDGWPEWCCDNQFGGSCQYVYEIELTGNVLKISGKSEITRFTYKYRRQTNCYSQSRWTISWKSVADQLASQ